MTVFKPSISRTKNCVNRQRRMLEINDARGQLFDLEMERLRLMLTNPLNTRLA